MVKTIAGKKTAAYSYNGEGYRVTKTENERTTNYLYEADKVVLETDVEGNETARNIYGTNLLTRTAQNDTMNYMYNGHGDVTALIGENGAIQATYYYDAFGNITEQTGDVNNSVTYAGYQYDKDTDLYYLNARYYDSKTARFLSEDTYTGDPNDPLSLNLYSYCVNNPITYSDPTGHWQESDKNLIQSARIAISQLTDIYVTTSDPELKKACAAQAAAIRNCSANIATTPQNSEVGMLYDQQLKKDGYVSASDWLKISNTYKKESTQNAINGLKITESPYVPSTYKNQAIKSTMNTVTAGVKKSTTQTKPQGNSNPSPRITNNGSAVKGTDNSIAIPRYSTVPKPTMTKEAAVDLIGNVDMNNFIGVDWFNKVYKSRESNSIPVVITYKDHDYTYSYMLEQCHPVSFFGVSIDSDNLYSYQLVYTDAPQYDYGIVFVGETSLDYMKDVTVLNGTYYSPKATIDKIGQIEAKGVDFSKFQKKIISSRPSTEGGSSNVIRYSDSNGTTFVIHEVTDASGKLIHRDFDAVRIESGQLINKK